MPLIQLIVLAIIQGITEFLPVSSSAHLILAPLIVKGWSDQGALIDVAAHVGTLFAVIAYFREETTTLFRGGIDALQRRPTDDRRLFLMILIATLPILAVGSVVALAGWLDALRSPTVIGWAFILFGVLLWHGDRRPEAKTELKAMEWRDALVIGAVQVLAIIPGSSRSGVTMTAARYLGWSRTEAARFSMLVAIPTIGASGLYAGASLAAGGAQESAAAALIVAVLSFLTALGAIAVFMRMTRVMSFTPFVIYRLIVGVMLLVFAGRLTGSP